MSTIIQKIIKALALIAITMAIAIAISSTYNNQQLDSTQNIEDDIEVERNDTLLVLPSKRVSRFLTENYDHHGRSLKPADHCHKDNEVCDSRYGKNFHCCGNKCFDLSIDKKHCGSCKNKCKFTYDCCNGQCVEKAYDKRHCGKCNNKCLKGQYCVYGMCDYA
ncbi:Stigma-specific STIG1-like protein 3 [Bienertia sinuspersici]